MSHSIMSKKEEQIERLCAIDCTWSKCKNLQIINTLEIFFHINNDDYFSITYCFHNTDFELWKKIIGYHTDNVNNSILLDEFDVKRELNEIKNNQEYYNFSLISKDFNLYRNINLLFYFEEEKENDEIDAINEVLRKTW
jgi:hypothetical protein